MPLPQEHSSPYRLPSPRIGSQDDDSLPKMVFGEPRHCRLQIDSSKPSIHSPVSNRSALGRILFLHLIWHYHHTRVVCTSSSTLFCYSNGHDSYCKAGEAYNQVRKPSFLEGLLF
ncbi:hypothetical protein Ccrd_020150 [Cynara cardunculus var. scolymus]|uniref:Uncharacterized protein n=1 Tax=Cynara cardunculus var. scolymus TaxID=59895 RepID=A0A103Y2Z5_CYNCS|nr:hypothetical protein Ccrd_020150 [Cynara cardunculus var. scolymus]